MKVAQADRNAVASLVLEARRRTRLSQRAFAALTATSGPTVSAYENGSKQARISTLERMARSAGLELQMRLAPGDRGALLRDRRERRSLALATATAGAVRRDFDRARRLAEENLERTEKVVGAAGGRWVEEWRRLLEAGPDAVGEALIDPGDHGHDLRQMSPFAGLLSDDTRQAVLDAAEAGTGDHIRQ